MGFATLVYNSHNADVNASRNIWASGMETIQKYGHGVFVRPIVSRYLATGYGGLNTMKCQSAFQDYS